MNNNYSNGSSPFGGSSGNNRERKSGKRGGGLAFIPIFIGLTVLGNVLTRVGGSGLTALVFLIPLLVIGLVVFIVIKTVRRSASGDGSPSIPRSVRAGHLCEEDSHERGASARNAAEVLDDMESGYQSYSHRMGGVSVHETYVYKRIKKMTREEFEKKLEELDSLLAAGMLTRDEYIQKRSEYRSATV